MKKKKAKKDDSVKVGIACPLCKDEIFSMSVHDFRRCKCGKVFVDGGDDYMRFGAEPPAEFKSITRVYKPNHVASHLMSAEVRDRLPLPPVPASYFIERDRFQIMWHWDSWNWPKNLGPFPASGNVVGSIFEWMFTIGPVTIRKWKDDVS